MAYPGGGTILDIPRLFVEQKFLQSRLANVRDPIVRQFWVGEMSQTSDYHKSEMLGWFLSKF